MNAYTTTQRAVLPDSVVWARGLLYAGGVICVLANLGYLSTSGLSPETVGQTVWSVWPGIAAFFLARGLSRGGSGRFWAVVTVGAVWVLMGLAELGRGEPRGLTSMVIPIVILVLMFRPAARRFMQGS